MSQAEMMRCATCGTEWMLEPALPGTAEGEVVECPVCHFRVLNDAMALAAIDSASDLEASLSALIAAAREGGLPSEAILQALREELEFAAELAHVGRNFSVQIIDLGPQDAELVQRPHRDRREILQTRSVGK